MFRFSAFASVLLALAWADSAPAQVNLRWKFKDGDTFFVEERLEGKTNISQMGQQTTVEQSEYRLWRFVVKNRPGGDIVLLQRIEAWKSKSSGGNTGGHDETKLLERLFKDVVFTIHMSPRGAVTRFEGYDEFTKKLNDQDAAEAKRLQAMAGENVLRAGLARIFDILPADAVKKGASWNRDLTASMGPLGNYKLAMTYTYLEPRDAVEQIGIKASLSFRPGKGDSADVGFKIIKLDLAKKEGSGRLAFDNAKGRLVAEEITMPLAGTMVIELMGTQVEVRFDGTDKRTIKMMDKKPDGI